MAKSKRSRIQSQSDVLEELFRSAANEEIRKVRDAFSRILEVKEKLLEENERAREKLSEKVQSLENQVEKLEKQNNQSKELEEKIAQFENKQSILMKHLLLERNKVKHKEKEISILKRDNFELDIEHEIERKALDDREKQASQDDTDEDAKDESEEESEEEEPNSKGLERVVVKKEMASDDEDR